MLQLAEGVQGLVEGILDPDDGGATISYSFFVKKGHLIPQIKISALMLS